MKASPKELLREIAPELLRTEGAYVLLVSEELVSSIEPGWSETVQFMFHAPNPPETLLDVTIRTQQP